MVTDRAMRRHGRNRPCQPIGVGHSMTGVVPYRRYYESTLRWVPNPGLWRDEREIALDPKLLRCAVRDAACFFLVFPILETLHKSGLVPVIFSLP
jgi:hypothetical protein